MSRLKKFLKIFIPHSLLIAYHLALAKLAAAIYGHPSQKLYVVGITGTKGKTSTANFIWSVLTSGKLTVGLIGTANIRIGDSERLNNFHMTMPDPFRLQKLLKEMVNAGCTHVVLEATSEGIKLKRHIGIIFDCAIFTNLTPEHLQSHGGSFEKYKQTKGELFVSLTQQTKQLDDKNVNRIIIANTDDEHSEYFLNFSSDDKISFGIKKSADIQAINILSVDDGITFDCLNDKFQLAVPGEFNVYNALPAIALGKYLNLSMEQIKSGLSNLKLIPGRMERIIEGQDFTVIVDYAHEQVSMTAAVSAARQMTTGKVIVLLGAEGGGRDRSKRAAMGQVVGEQADVVVVSNVDPYDDDPKEIIHEIADAAVAAGKVIGQNLFREPNRRKGIAKAFSLAAVGDIVLLTGKGAEQSMIIGNQTIPWDDRTVAREELRQLLKIKFSQPNNQK